MHKKIILCVSFLLFSLEGCAPTIIQHVLRPAELGVGNYTNIAILDFDGKNGKSIARLVESTLMQAKVNGNPYFKLVDRTRLEKVLSEQRFQTSGLADPSAIIKIGNILGVQAIITGNVDAYDSEDLNVIEQREKYDPRTKQSYYYDVRCLQRRVFVSFTANVIGVQTGAIDASDSEQTDFTAKQCQGGETIGEGLARVLTGGIEFGPKEKMLREASLNAISKFVKKIVPQTEAQVITLKENDDDSSILNLRPTPQEKTIAEGMKSGCEYAKASLWDKAISSWNSVLQVKPNCAAAIYNIGVAWETKGDLLKAKEGYDQALSLKPGDSDYIKATANINRRIQEKEELDKQLVGRTKKELPVVQKPISPKTKTVLTSPSILAPKEAQAASPPPSVLTPKEVQVASPPSPSPSGKSLVCIKRTNVRAEANDKSKVIATLKNGEKVENLGKSGNWYNVKLSSGLTGFVSKDLVNEIQ